MSEPVAFPKPPRGFPWRLLGALLISLAALGGLGYYAWQQRSDLKDTRGAKAKLAEVEQNLKEEQALLESCDQARMEMDARCTTVETSLQQMQSDLNATKGELDELRKQRAEVAKRLEAFKELTAQFQKMIDSGQIDVAIRKGQMTVKLPAGVLFESGQANLSRDGELALMEVAVVLRKFVDRKFMIVGHTDNRPLEAATDARFRNNWELSTARAVRVVDFMIEAKLKPENLIAAGVGEFDPIADNKSPKGRQENRRIEIVLLPNLAELPAAGLETPPQDAKTP